MQKLKPARDYAGQIEQLEKEHALIIDDHVEAIQILSTVSYYRLSAYGIGIKCAENTEHYLPGITLRHLYRLHQFDSRFRTLLMPLIETLEIELRTKIAYHLVMTYGADVLYNELNFQLLERKDGKTWHSWLLCQFKNEMDRQKDKPLVRHHIEKYGGRFPLWAAVELFSFGMLSTLYKIMKEEDKVAVAKQFSTATKYMKSWILALLEVRNMCAHYGRLYNMPLMQSPRLYGENTKYRSNRVFPLLLTIRRMLGKRQEWTTFYTSLIGLMDEYPEVRLSFIGFPVEWRECLEIPT